MLEPYTSAEDVRAVLGVSSTELPDTKLSMGMYATLLALRLEDVSSTLPASFLAVAALPPESRTSTQNRLYDLTRLFAAYALAKELLVSLPLFGVKNLTDGQAGFSRQVDVYADVREGVDATFIGIKYKLALVYAAVEPSATVIARVTAPTTVLSTLGTDPVTA